jgi:hypothetical protein
LYVLFICGLYSLFFYSFVCLTSENSFRNQKVLCNRASEGQETGVWFRGCQQT